MKILDYLIENLLKIKPESEAKLYEISGRVVFFIIMIELTLFLCRKIGVPLPYHIFSIETLNLLISEYYIVIVLATFVSLQLALTLSIYMVNELAIRFIRFFQFGNYWPPYIFLSRRKKISLLKSRTAMLKFELGRKHVEIQPAALSLISFIFRFSLISLLFYYFVVRSTLPIFYQHSVSKFGLLICTIFWVTQNYGEFYRTQKEYLRKYLLRTVEKLEKIDPELTSDGLTSEFRKTKNSTNSSYP